MACLVLPAGREPAGDEADDQEKEGHGCEGEGIVGGDAPKLANKDSGQGKARGQPNSDAGQQKLQALSEHHPQDIASSCAESHANAELMGPPRGTVRNHAVDTDGDENQTDEGKDDDQLEAETGLSKRKKIQEVFERVGVGHRNSRVGGPNFTANGIDHGGGIAGGSDEDAAHAGSGEGVWDPGFGIDRILEAEILSVGGHTNDFEPGVLHRIGKVFQNKQVDPAPDGIFVAEVAALKGFVDHREIAAVIDFRFGEGSAFEQGEEEGSELDGVLISLSRERNASGQHMVHLEAKTHFLKGAETANEQPGREKKRERERHLEDDDGVSQTGTPNRAVEAFAGIPQRILEVAAGSLQRRNEAEHKDGPDSNHYREE